MPQDFVQRITDLSNGSRPVFPQDIPVIECIGTKRGDLNNEDAGALIKLINLVFKESALEAGHSETEIRALTTKFRDAGRRSAPWKPTSSRVPGRPQDGSDGNRIKRWLLPIEHKFYANEIDATLVEVKYFLQALSMVNSPDVTKFNIRTLFTPWLIKHEVIQGGYRDPLQRVQLDFNEFIKDARLLQSGHLDPLDRDGRHVPENTYLMLARSNQIQGNMKMNELLDLMKIIVTDHELNPFI
jgi:hypothetical protein